MFTQRFEVRGEAPQRYSLVPFLLLGATLSLDIHRGLYATVDLSAETHFLPLLRETLERSVSFALRTSLGIGQRF